MLLNYFQVPIEVQPKANRKFKVKYLDNENLLQEMQECLEFAYKELPALSKDTEKKREEVKIQIIQKYQKIAQEIREEFGNITGERVTAIPAPQVELIYRLSYYFIQYWGYTQKDVAKMLGISEKMKDKYGITPQMDYKSYHLNYQTPCILDNQYLLREILPFVGDLLNRISNIYFIAISDEIGLVANINTSITKRKGVRQQFFSRKHFLIAAVIHDGVQKFKEELRNCLKTETKEITERVLEFMIDKIEVKREYLRSLSISKFNEQRDKYLDCQFQVERYQEAKDSGDPFLLEETLVDYEDMVLGIKAPTVEELLEQAQKRKEAILDELKEEINIRRLEKDSNVDIFRGWFKGYKEKLDDEKIITMLDQDEDLELAAMFYIIEFFDRNDITKETYQFLLDSISPQFKESGSLGELGRRLEYEKIMLIQEEFDFKTILDKTEKGITSTIFIDTSVYDITESEINWLLNETDVHLILLTKEQREELQLQEYKLEVNEGYYIYTDID